MDTRWKKFSHSLFTKFIVFMIVIFCFSSAITIMVNSYRTRGDITIAFEESYYQGKEYIQDSNNVIDSLKGLIKKYKSEEHILAGGTLTEDELQRVEDTLFSDFANNSKSYNPNLSQEENERLFKEVYAEKISQQKDELIQQDLREYQASLRRVEEYQGLLYYASNGVNEFTNSPSKDQDYFKSFPSYLIFADYEQQVSPAEITANPQYFWITSNGKQLARQDLIYLGFTDEFLSPRMNAWAENKIIITASLYQLLVLLTALVAAFIYLLIVIGRKPGGDQGVHLNTFDRIYNDFKLVACVILIALWLAFINAVSNFNSFQLTFAVTVLIAAAGLVLVLSLVKHLKNRTFFKHTLTYTVLAKLFSFFKDIYHSGSVGVKVVLIVIGYPLLVAATFFMFPLTIGVAAWLALRKVKEFKAIKEGVQKVKAGDIHHTIDVSGQGEFATLAADINGITEGLNKAVANELKSERLKTELITNVSHDIRTPLTSIITYVDLLKNEKDPIKSAQYVAVIDEKAQRLKILTEDLFEAAKASSGNMPVNLEKIDLVALITQGLGELNDKIQERKLEFKLNYPTEKVYLQADGKLLWRALENLLSNIFKYALEGSRVYIDILVLETGVTLIIKNISAYELNISSEELMQRFTRGDESRTSQGSGLGLSIAKSLIENQKGSFQIEIDGDLFKAIIQMAKAE